jgi:hypothetical protein
MRRYSTYDFHGKVEGGQGDVSERLVTGKQSKGGIMFAWLSSLARLYTVTRTFSFYSPISHSRFLCSQV